MHMLLTNCSPRKHHPHASYLNPFSDLLWLKIPSSDIKLKDHIPSLLEKNYSICSNGITKPNPPTLGMTAFTKDFFLLVENSF